MTTSRQRPRLAPAIGAIVRGLSHADMVRVCAEAGVAYNTLVRMREAKYRPYVTTVRAVTAALAKLGFLPAKKGEWRTMARPGTEG